MKTIIVLLLVGVAASAPQFGTTYTKTTKQFVSQGPQPQIQEQRIYQSSSSTGSDLSSASQFESRDAKAVHRPVAILSFVRDVQPSGDYQYSFDAENGIKQEEQGSLKLVRDEKNEEHPVPSVRGSYQYIGPDQQTYTVHYVADELGFRATGAHIPEIPEAIKKSLETLPPLDYKEEPRIYNRGF